MIKIVLIYVLFILGLWNQTLSAQVWTKGNILESNIHYSNFQHQVNITNGKIYAAGEFEIEIDVGTQKRRSFGETDIFIVEYDSNFDVLNLWTLGTPNVDRFGSFKVDQKGNIYVTGYFRDSLILGLDTLVSIGGFDFFMFKMTSDYQYLWSKSYGSIADDIGAFGVGVIALSNSGSVFTYSQFSQLENLPLVLKDSIVKPYGDSDGLILKHDAIGNLIWAQAIGSKRFDNFPPELILKNDMLFVGSNASSGIYYQNRKYGNPYVGDLGILLCLDTLYGFPKWHVGIHNRDFGIVKLSAFDTDSEGNTYFTGTFYTDLLEVGGKTISNTFNLYGIDVYIAKVNRFGVTQWVNVLRSGATDGVSDITVSDDNQVFVSGYYTEQCYYQNDTIGYIGQSGKNGFVLEIDSNGDSQYFQSIGNNGSTDVNQVTPLESGQLLISGTSGPGELRFDGKLDFDLNADYNNYLALGNPDSIKLSTQYPQKGQIKVYPNPCFDRILITSLYENAHAQIKVYNVLGDLVLDLTTNDITTQISTSDWIQGVYLITLFNEKSSQFISTRIIKN